ncbi:transcriptional regulator, LacI family [Alistipes timonensis JC136]|uniref:Transcriptional regulator, LacI family n=3 Tax=Alistipes timonensis TaxID=1465754 RepID=A0A1H3ZMH6_9BACT|nr:transcriptional regulator, LacI family [Alistipes timonensis JC136]
MIYLHTVNLKEQLFQRKFIESSAMIESERTATMEQVAQAAGVSIGTVDRVLHNREGVSEKTRKKVFKVINEIGYKPNIYASILSRRKDFSIVAIIPYFQTGEYWELVYSGITRAVKQSQGLNIDLKIFYYNQFDLESFRGACRNTIDAQPDALFIAPIYKEDTIRLVHRLTSLSIPVAYIDTKPENTDYLAYFGMPLFESGYLAADLLVGKDPGVKEVVSFNIDRGEAPPNDSMLTRHRGFRAYLDDNNPGCKLTDCSMSPFDFLHNMRLFDAFFEEHPDVKHIVTFNSRAHLVSDWMEIRGIRDKKLLGFDMLQANMRALKNGTISVLIAERTDKEAFNAVKSLIDFLVLRQRPRHRDNFSSIDILTRYNVDFYLAEE